MRRLHKVLAIVAGAMAITSAHAQESSISSLIQGSGLPEEILASELKAEHKAVKITLSAGSQGGGFIDMIMGMFGGLAGAMGGGANQSPDQAQGMALLGALQLYWSNGQTVKAGGQEFLVAYRIELGPEAMQGSAPPKLDPASTKMTLSLINFSSVAMLSPKPSMTREAFWKILKDAENIKPPAELPANPPISVTDAPLDMHGQHSSNLKQIGLAMHMYCADFDDVLPGAQASAGALYAIHPYLKNVEAMRTLNPNGGRILFNVAIGGVKIDDIEEPANTVIFYDEKPWPDNTRCIVMVDGSVKTIEEDKWSIYQTMLKWTYKKTAKPLPADYGVEWARENGLAP